MFTGNPENEEARASASQLEPAEDRRSQATIPHEQPSGNKSFGYSQGFLPYNGSPPCVRTSETSRAAANRIRGHANVQRARVLEHIIMPGEHGSTDEEVQAALGLKVQTETPRRCELVKMGLVTASGRRRPTSSGRPANVWVATTAATRAGE